MTAPKRLPRPISTEDGQEIAALLVVGDEVQREHAEQQLATLTPATRLALREQALLTAKESHDYPAVLRCLQPLEAEFPDASVTYSVIYRLACAGYAAQRTGDTDAALQFHRRQFTHHIVTNRTESTGSALAYNLHSLADTFLQRGEDDAAYPLLLMSADIYRALPFSSEFDADTVLHLLDDLCDIDQKRGNREAERAHLDEALTVAREMRDVEATARWLYRLSRFYWCGEEYEAAYASAAESLALYDSFSPGDRGERYDLLHALAWSAFKTGDLVAYEKHLIPLRRDANEETLSPVFRFHAAAGVAKLMMDCFPEEARPALEYAATLGASLKMADLNEAGLLSRLYKTEVQLGYLCSAAGEIPEAEKHYRAALPALRYLVARGQSPHSPFYLFRSLEWTATKQKQFERAARLRGAKEGLSSAEDKPLLESTDTKTRNEEKQLIRRLGRRRFDALLAEGRAMDTETAMAYALSEEPMLVVSRKAWHPFVARWLGKREKVDA